MQEDEADDIDRVVAELMAKYQCEEHPSRVCYTKRGQHQTLLPVLTRMWAQYIVGTFAFDLH